MYSLEEVRNVDPEIAQAIVDEQDRQNSHIELIASENWVSKAVMAAMGSPLTNKYAEGYPGKRYYGGCLRGRGGAAGHPAGKGTVRLRVCQCAAPLRRPGQYGGAVRGLQPRGHHHGDEPGPRRAPDPRKPGEHVRQIFQHRPLWGGRQWIPRL